MTRLSPPATRLSPGDNAVGYITYGRGDPPLTGWARRCSGPRSRSRTYRAAGAPGTPRMSGGPPSGPGVPKGTAPAQPRSVQPDQRRAGHVSGCRTTGMAGSSGTRGRGVAGRLPGDDGADGLPPLERVERRGDIGQGVEVGGEWLGAGRARGPGGGPGRRGRGGW